MTVLIIEDSPTAAMVISESVYQCDPDAKVCVVSDWLDAAGKIATAALVIIDWFTPDTPESYAGLEAMELLGIPHFVWTASPERVPSNVHCPVVRKGDSVTETISTLLRPQKA